MNCTTCGSGVVHVVCHACRKLQYETPLLEKLKASETARVAAEEAQAMLRGDCRTMEGYLATARADRDRAVAEVERLRILLDNERTSHAREEAAFKAERDEWKRNAEMLRDAVQIQQRNESAASRLADAHRGEENVRSNHGAAPGVTTSRPAEGSDEPGTSSHPAPSPSARAEEAVAYARNVNGVWKGILLATDEDRSYLDAAVRDWGGTVHALYMAPPDLTATLAEARRERDENIAERIANTEHYHAEIAKLKVQLDIKSTSYDGAQSAVAWWVEEGKRLVDEIAKLKAERDDERAGRERAAKVVHETSVALGDPFCLPPEAVAQLRAQLDGTRVYWVVKFKDAGTYRRNGAWKGRRHAMRFPSLREARKDMRLCIKGGFYEGDLAVYRVKPKPAGQR